MRVWVRECESLEGEGVPKQSSSIGEPCLVAAGLVFTSAQGELKSGSHHKRAVQGQESSDSEVLQTAVEHRLLTCRGRSRLPHLAEGVCHAHSVPHRRHVVRAYDVGALGHAQRSSCCGGDITLGWLLAACQRGSMHSYGERRGGEMHSGGWIAKLPAPQPDPPDRSPPPPAHL